jgi:hypothetical protein
MADSSRNWTIWPIPISQIEEIVAAHLGPGRVRSNAAAPCLSRQVSMYLAKHVAGWSLPKIGASITAATTRPFYMGSGRLNVYGRPTRHLMHSWMYSQRHLHLRASGVRRFRGPILN